MFQNPKKILTIGLASLLALGLCLVEFRTHAQLSATQQRLAAVIRDTIALHSKYEQAHNAHLQEKNRADSLQDVLVNAAKTAQNINININSGKQKTRTPKQRPQ